MPNFFLLPAFFVCRICVGQHASKPCLRCSKLPQGAHLLNGIQVVFHLMGSGAVSSFGLVEQLLLFVGNTQ